MRKYGKGHWEGTQKTPFPHFHFGATPGNIQGLLRFMNSEVTPEDAWDHTQFWELNWG